MGPNLEVIYPVSIIGDKILKDPEINNMVVSPYIYKLRGDLDRAPVFDDTINHQSAIIFENELEQYENQKQWFSQRCVDLERKQLIESINSYVHMNLCDLLYITLLNIANSLTSIGICAKKTQLPKVYELINQIQNEQLSYKSNSYEISCCLEYDKLTSDSVYTLVSFFLERKFQDLLAARLNKFIFIIATQLIDSHDMETLYSRYVDEQATVLPNPAYNMIYVNIIRGLVQPQIDILYTAINQMIEPIVSMCVMNDNNHTYKKYEYKVLGSTRYESRMAESMSHDPLITDILDEISEEGEE